MKKTFKTKMAAGVMALLLAVGTIFSGAAAPMEVKAAAETPKDPTEGMIDMTQEGILTIKKNKSTANTPLAGAEFTIYKIMDLQYDATTGKYSYTPDTHFTSVFNDKNIIPDEFGTYSAAELEDKIAEFVTFAKTLADNDGKGTTADTTGVVEFTGLDLGYYLVVETKAPAGYILGNPFLVAIPSTEDSDKEDDDNRGDFWNYHVVAEPKNANVPLEKDFAVDENGEQDGTVAVGDYIKYQITTTIPDYTGAEFENAEVTFTLTDTMSDGLSIINETNADYATYPITVTVGTEENPENAYTITAAPATGTNADLTVAFASDYIKAHKGEAVVLTYWAQVTSGAVTGTAGNPNNVKLEYSNKPGEANGSTEDKKIVYSFKLDVEKFTGTNTALDGATFELYEGNEFATATYLETATTANGGKLSFEKLDEGTYWLKETKAPGGYTLLTNPIKVVITAVIDPVTKELTSFTLTVNGEVIELADDANATTDDWKTRHDQTSGTATVAVENHPGFNLPATGGNGILIFLLIGFAGIVVISLAMSKKTGEEE